MEELGFVIGLHLYFWPWIDSMFPDPCPRLISQSTSPVGRLYVHGTLYGLHGGAQSWHSSPIPSDWSLYPVFSCTSAPFHHFSFLLHHLPVKVFLFIFFLTYTYILN